jgi:IclR family transcriptional regulator, KDG regulon repressor
MSVRSIKSAERTLALFELFSLRESRLTVGETARELGIPQPSASMLLRNLTELGYLDYDRRTRTFGTTIRVLLLGSWITRRFNEAGGMAGALSQLQAAVDGESVSMAIQNGAAVQYIATIESEQPERLRVQAGELRTLTCSAVGRALLSLKTDLEIGGWVRRSNAEAQEDRLKVRESDFLQLINRVRKQGFAETAGDSRPGIGAYAIVIPSPLGDMPLAIGAGGPLERIGPKRERMIDALLEMKAKYTPTS